MLLDFVVCLCFVGDQERKWKGLHEYYNMETQKVDFFSKKLKIEFCPYPEKRNRPGFVGISPTLIIDYINGKVFTCTTALKPKKFNFFQKSSKLTKLNFVRTLRKEIALALSISVLHW